MYLEVKRSASEMSEEACIDTAAAAFALNRKRICVPAEIPPLKRLNDLPLRNYMEHPVRRKSRVFVPSVVFFLFSCVVIYYYISLTVFRSRLFLVTSPRVVWGKHYLVLLLHLNWLSQTLERKYLWWMAILSATSLNWYWAAPWICS